MQLNVNITCNVTNRICFALKNFSFKNHWVWNDITIFNNEFTSSEAKHNYAAELEFYCQTQMQKQTTIVSDLNNIKWTFMWRTWVNTSAENTYDVQNRVE